MLGEKILGANSPSLRNVRSDRSPEVFGPVSTRVASPIKAPRVDMIAIERGVFAVHFGRDDNASPEKWSEAFDNPVVLANGFGPRQMMGPRILYPMGKEIEHFATGEDFLDALIVEELAAHSGSIRQNGVSPFVVWLVWIQVRGHENFLDAASDTDGFDRYDGRLALNVVLRANGGPVVEIIASVGPEAPFHDMVGISGGRRAEDAALPVAGKDCVAKPFSGKQQRLGAHVVRSFQKGWNCIRFSWRCDFRKMVCRRQGQRKISRPAASEPWF